MQQRNVSQDCYPSTRCSNRMKLYIASAQNSMSILDLIFLLNQIKLYNLYVIFLLLNTNSSYNAT